MLRARYCCDPREVSGVKPTMKKWRRGKGMRLTASFRRSELSCPGKRRQHVTPLMVVEMRRQRRAALTAGVGELEGPEADVVERLVVQHHALVGVLHQLVHRQRRVVRLHDRVRHLGRREHRERHHHPIRVLLPDLGDQQRPHARPRPPAQRVADLKPCSPPRASARSRLASLTRNRRKRESSQHRAQTLEEVAVLSLLADHVEDGVDELSALGIVALGPVVAGAVLAEDEVVGAEQLAVGAGAHRVHGPRLQVHEHRPRHVPAAAGLVVVDVNALQLQPGVTDVVAVGVDAVLVRHHLPELGPDLVAALAGLDVQDLPHG
ncbi:hypothetical protein MUK42_34782 [Musa troglodytarum]|uniref:Uncharacterized protein n=1 Tax=Musa troglodytarum TaxID=320322 RepID=A0A9E7K6V0_9LILI|nr:hypothetical protein MUK42_34782 [Musa troglodytarum]